jgi:hypothetical protein
VDLTGSVFGPKGLSLVGINHETSSISASGRPWSFRNRRHQARDRAIDT